MEANENINNDSSQHSKTHQSTSKDPFNMRSCKESLFNKENQSVPDTNQQGSEDECEEYNGTDSEDDLDINEEELEKRDKELDEDELQRLKGEATNLKNAGNECFKAANHNEAVLLYTRALKVCPLKYNTDRSILYANRAAAQISMEKKDYALLDCNKAIELNPDYLRAILRRAQLHKKMDNLERCLEDYSKILELDKNNLEARQACATLPAEIAERNEKLKQEMFGKLKELGNLCLKPFGLSTENFKVNQDPNTGGYSMSFQK